MPLIKLFALSTCIHCRHTKQYLDEKNAPYEFVYVDQLTGDERKQTIEEVKRHNKACSFPTIVVNDGETVIIGFKKDEIDQVLTR